MLTLIIFFNIIVSHNENLSLIRPIMKKIMWQCKLVPKKMVLLLFVII